MDTIFNLCGVLVYIYDGDFTWECHVIQHYYIIVVVSSINKLKCIFGKTKYKSPVLVLVLGDNTLLT